MIKKLRRKREQKTIKTKKRKKKQPIFKVVILTLDTRIFSKNLSKLGKKLNPKASCSSMEI